ncbi:Platinum sensitivity protein [Myotisia sp. PD_48]|nr:Platinum sensitivity protein [Myotisia sp. PD_48]
MSVSPPSPNDRKRVKVYELRSGDWFDRGTGFCTAKIINDEPKVLVQSEDQPERMLLETRISREDGYQKQQETLIVWTEPSGTDMALSFQEAEGCGVIWDFVRQVQQHLNPLGGVYILFILSQHITIQMDLANHEQLNIDDGFSDDALDPVAEPVILPSPDMTNLAEIEQTIVSMSITQAGRDAIARLVIQENYLMKLLPLVSVAEDLEGLPDLHRLCNIMKALILLNDNTIIEQVVSDPVITAVVGAMEYDPDFPTHKANHRQYLNDRTRFREVVPIKDPIILRKIRHTWRLQYLKDVVLARILDDPTFSVLNSLIFFNQVDIVQHLQTNTVFLGELFSLFTLNNTDNKKKEDAVQFIHQCMGIAKNLQVAARGNLFVNLINFGLFSVIAFAVRHPSPAIRTTGIDILVALLDHDPIMIRGYMSKAVNDKKVSLMDTLIDLLHSETDLGVKGQLSDAVKILLDPHSLQETISSRTGEIIPKMRQPSPQDTYLQAHFEEAAHRLFIPLKNLETRSSLHDLSFQEVSLYAYLVDILTFFVRQHPIRSRNIIRAESLVPRVAQLLQVPQKHLKLIAVKFFRALVSLQDTFYYAQMNQHNTFELILNVVFETMPRDNLLNSACLELFEYIKRENIKPIISHVVEIYRDKLKDITYVDTFQNLVLRYDQMQGYGAEVDATLFSQEEAITPSRTIVAGWQRWNGTKEMDAAEEEYFDTSDDEEEEVGLLSLGEGGNGVPNLLPKTHYLPENAQNKLSAGSPVSSNGSASPSAKPLVDYPDDDDEDDIMTANSPVQPFPQSTDPHHQAQDGQPSQPQLAPSTDKSSQPLHFTFAEKRRRQEDEEDDELVKLSSGPKRRNSISTSSTTSWSSVDTQKKKRGFSAGQPIVTSLAPEKKESSERRQQQQQPQQQSQQQPPGNKKIAFNISVSPLTCNALQDSPTSDTDLSPSSPKENVRPMVEGYVGDGGGGNEDTTG